MLPIPPIEWFEEVLRVHDLVLAALSLEVLTHANELPWHHRDPADRFIISTAVLEGLAIVTADRKFEMYDVEVMT